MGLDTYLSAVSAQGTKTRLMYWRKCYRLDEWFLNNAEEAAEVEEGAEWLDKKDVFIISRPKLWDLLNKCEESVRSLNPDILGHEPTYGDGMYDSDLIGLLSQLRDDAERLRSFLNNPCFYNHNFYYERSY